VSYVVCFSYIETTNVGSSTIGLLASELVFRQIASSELPPNQWQKEVNLWFSTGLAQLQSSLLNFLGRIDQTDSGTYSNYLIYQSLDDMASGPEKDAAYKNCHNQKIVSTGQYQNFDFVAVLTVVLLSLLIALASLILEPCIQLSRRRWVSKEGQVRQYARTFDSKFWLLRMALEGIGVGTWRRGGRKETSEIPITEKTVWICPPEANYAVDNFYKCELPKPRRTSREL
jgi:hypothetical protein